MAFHAFPRPARGGVRQDPGPTNKASVLEQAGDFHTCSEFVVAFEQAGDFHTCNELGDDEGDCDEDASIDGADEDF